MITIILGMHRSGTSTVAGILHLNKIVMGTYQNFWPRPLPQNPKGFYENYDFRKINDKLMQKAGYNVKSFESKIPLPTINNRMKKTMIKMVNKYQSNYEHWGWKDPRTCLTITQWMEIFREMELDQNIKIIFVTRSAIAVARSLKKRNELSLINGMALWKSYTERVLDFCEHNDFPIFFMSFEGILKAPEDHCEKMFDFLETNFDPTIVKHFVDKNISTSGMGEDAEIPNDISDLEFKIEKLLAIK